MLPRRAIVKRCRLWTAAIALLDTAYLALEPFVVTAVDIRYRWMRPMTDVIYVPVGAYLSDHELPGSESFGHYVRRCSNWTRCKLTPVQLGHHNWPRQTHPPEATRQAIPNR